MAPRKMLKAAAVLITLGYCSLLVCQSGVRFKFQKSRAVTVQVSDLPLEPGTIIDKSAVENLTLDDIFKTVKTSKHQCDIPFNFRESPAKTVQVFDLPLKPVNTLNESAVENLTLDDIFITVKTSKRFQNSRLPIILKTWFQFAKEQTWFFTDTDNSLHQRQTNGHMVNTKCSASHRRKDLCCKMSAEYDHFLDSDKKWFCHFDDDNYVNVPRLVTILQRFNHQQEWYLGRPSTKKATWRFVKSKTLNLRPKNFKFWFATGGAGLCISRSLAFKMLPVASGGRFISVCEDTRLPDDVTMGFIIRHVGKTNLTFVPEFHSHLEKMKLLPVETFRDQISFGYSGTKGKMNVVNVPGYNTTYDPTRFLSLHCLLSFLFPSL